MGSEKNLVQVSQKSLGIICYNILGGGIDL